jgi:hypothetical protein
MDAHRNLSDGPRELDDDELMAAEDDNDQLLVFGLPAEDREFFAAAEAMLRPDNRSAPSNGDRWNNHRHDSATARNLLQQQQYEQQPNRPSIGQQVTNGSHQSINGDVASRQKSAMPLSIDVSNGRCDCDGTTENSSVTATQHYLNGIKDTADRQRQQLLQQRTTVGRDSMSPSVTADELFEPKVTADASNRLMVKTSLVNDYDSISDDLLSPSSNGGPLSPASSVSSSTRRSALPVPTWHNGR